MCLLFKYYLAGRRFSKYHQRTVLELEWANGLHPFAPFSGGIRPALSELQVDIAKRNIILSRLDHAVSTNSKKKKKNRVICIA